VVPKYFWNGVDDFLRNGAGFSLYADGVLASTAYSSYVLDDKLELGIETVEGFRRRGYAYHVCAALIDYCLAEGYEPVWSCRLENVGSYNLAQRLGFVPTLELPYYRLSG
jgi:RimJ/RimL family protein N-acetyltransferase